MNISTVISFCTNDIEFINECIKNAFFISNEVVVVYASQLFDGTPENMEEISELKKYWNCTFVESDIANISSHRAKHNKMRADGFLATTQDWVLFLDSDEIIDYLSFQEWSKTRPEFDHYEFNGYWYFRQANFRAKTTEAVCTLSKKNKISYDKILLSEGERKFIRYLPNYSYQELKTPIVHHYSWVRSEIGMLKKVKAWGHSHERDWEKLIKEEFSRPFNGTDFVHGYQFDIL